MDLSRSCAVFKYLVVFVNFIFWLSGVSFLSLATWMLNDPTVYLRVLPVKDYYYIVIYVCLVTGALMFVIGLLGCSGAYNESPCMLISFSCCLLVVLVTEVAAGAWAYGSRKDLEQGIKVNVRLTVQEQYGVIESHTTIIDAIQKGLHCCGADGPEDWATSQYNAKDKSDLLAPGSLEGNYTIPVSCCKLNDIKGEQACISRQNGNFTIYSDGCTDKLFAMLGEKYMSITVGVCIGVGVVEILELIFSLILCLTIRSVDRNKNLS